MHTFLLLVHVGLCLALVVLVLLQQGKGAGIGAAFGGSSQTIFGGRGPTTFFQKLTTIFAVLFLGTSLSLAKISKQTANSVMDAAVGKSGGGGVGAPIDPYAKPAASPIAAPVPAASPVKSPTK